MQPSTLRRHGALLWLVLLGSCQCHGNVLEHSGAHAANGNYYLAYTTLEAARNPANTDPAIEKAYWDARLQYLIDMARRNIFQEREQEALLDLNQALAQDPGNMTVLGLLERAHEKVAWRAANRGDVALGGGDLEGALLAYAEAQRAVPGYPAALAGTKEVKLAFDKLRAKAQQHFLEALRKFPELRMYEVDFHATAALSRDPSREDARVLGDKAERVLAEERFRRAKASEQKGSYGAALMDYRQARKLDESLPLVDESIEHMQNEVKAQSLIDKAKMRLIRKQFDSARKTLDEALQLTVLEKAQISEIIHMARKSEAEVQYEAARALELQGNKQEALDAFKVLAAAWPDGVQDTAARISNLELDIGAAEKAYASGVEAEGKSEWAAAVEHYQTAVTCYAKYKDAKARLEQVKAKVR